MTPSPSPPDAATGPGHESPPGGASCSGGFYNRRDARNQRRADAWLFAAMAAFLSATAALHLHAVHVPAPLCWLLVGLTAALSLQAIRSFRAFLRTADELLRVIHLQALATG